MRAYLKINMKNLLQETYPLSQEAIAFYQKNRYIKLKNVLDAETLTYYGAAITKKVLELNSQDKPLDQRDTYGKAFLQIFNLLREDDTCKEFVMSPRLGQIAAELMQAEGARIYHDQALFKEAGGGITPWPVSYTHLDVYKRQDMGVRPIMLKTN